MIKYGGYSLVGHLQLEYGFTSTALAYAPQLCLRSTALAYAPQLCLRSTTLAITLQLVLTLYSSCVRSSALAYTATALDLSRVLISHAFLYPTDDRHKSYDGIFYIC